MDATQQVKYARVIIRYFDVQFGFARGYGVMFGFFSLFYGSQPCVVASSWQRKACSQMIRQTRSQWAWAYLIGRGVTKKRLALNFVDVSID